MADRQWLTPPEMAREYRMKPESVIAEIKNGSLRAIDVSSKPGVGRSRYRIARADIIAWEERRVVRPPAPRAARRRRQPEGVIQFF